MSHRNAAFMCSLSLPRHDLLRLEPSRQNAGAEGTRVEVVEASPTLDRSPAWSSISFTHNPTGASLG